MLIGACDLMLQPIHVFRYAFLPDGTLVAARPDRATGRYGNFDIILDHFSRISQLSPTPLAL